MGYPGVWFTSGSLVRIPGFHRPKHFICLRITAEDIKLKKQTHLKTFVSHKKLVEILEKSHPNQFRVGMHNHLENHFARIFDNTPQSRDKPQSEN